MVLNYIIDAKLKELFIKKDYEIIGYTNNPELLHDIPRINASNQNLDYIKKEFGPGLNVIYDGLVINWYDKNLFPPSIDSMFFMKTLNEQNYTKKPLNRIIDVGTGTGVLGMYLAKNNPHIKEAILTDY